MRAAGRLGARPLVVVAQGRHALEAPEVVDLGDDRGGVAAAMAANMLHAARFAALVGPVWRELQEELAGLSSRGRLVVADSSDHMVPLEAPEVVVGAIRVVVDEVRG